MHKMGDAFRFFLLMFSLVPLAGVWLTGFDRVHWLLFIPPAAGTFAAITGIFPGMIMARKMFGEQA